MISALIVIVLGLAAAAFGLFQLERIESKNSILATLKKGGTPDERKIEALKEGSAEDRLIAAHFYLKKKEVELLEEILTQIIIDRRTPKFFRVRALYNLAGWQVIKGFMTQDPSAFKNAIFYYQESLRLEPDFFPAKYNLERLIQENPERQQNQKEEEGQKESEERKERKLENNQPDINPPPTDGLP
jgi:hypothetical protein